MSQFSQILAAALDQSDIQKRSLAEQQLQVTCFQDTAGFFTNLVKELILESNDINLRQFSGTLIKNSIRLVNAQNEFLWNTIDATLRENIKTTLLSTMVCKIPALQKSSANAISTIFTVEVAQNRWFNLISELAMSTQATVAADLRKAAIMTLGQICDKLKEFKLGKMLTEQMKENVLMAILIGLSPEEQDLVIKENSIVALGDCVEFMTTTLEREQVRDYATELLFNSLKHPNGNIKLVSLQRTCDYVKALYPYLGKYIPNLLQVTQEFILSDDEELSAPAMEIWTTLATEFHEREEVNAEIRANHEQQQNPNHILLVHEELTKTLLKNLLKNQNDGDEEAESSTQEAAQKALCSIVEAVGDAVLPTFSAFISNTIADQQWNYRQGALLAFSALLDGISENQILSMISSAFQEIIKKLLDPSLKVIESAAKFLAKIAECYPQTLLLRTDFIQALEVIINSLKQKPEISRHICWTISNMAENMDKYPENCLTGSTDYLLQALISNCKEFKYQNLIILLFYQASRSDLTASHLNVIDVSFIAVLNIIHFSKNPDMALQYLNLFLQSFKGSYQIPVDHRQTLQSGILSAIHACMIVIDNKFNPNMSAVVLDLIDEYFRYCKDVDSNGMYIISSLANCIGPVFANYLDQVWKYIEHTLDQKKEDFELYKVCIGTIGDIARACQHKFNTKVSVLQKLYDALESPLYSKEIKLFIFSCIGDIFLSVKEIAEPQLEKFLIIFNKAFQDSIQLSASDNSELQDYSEQLKEKLISSYTCVLHGINDNSHNQLIFNNLQQLIQFIMITCDKSIHPTVDYVRNCLSLLIDIGNFYQKLVSPIIKNQFTYSLIDTLKQHDFTEDGQEVISYAQKHKAVIAIKKNSQMSDPFHQNVYEELRQAVKQHEAKGLHLSLKGKQTKSPYTIYEDLHIYLAVMMKHKIPNSEVFDELSSTVLSHRSKESIRSRYKDHIKEFNSEDIGKILKYLRIKKNLNGFIFEVDNHLVVRESLAKVTKGSNLNSQKQSKNDKAAKVEIKQDPQLINQKRKSDQNTQEVKITKKVHTSEPQGAQQQGKQQQNDRVLRNTTVNAINKPQNNGHLSAVNQSNEMRKQKLEVQSEGWEQIKKQTLQNKGQIDNVSLLQKKKETKESKPVQLNEEELFPSFDMSIENFEKSQKENKAADKLNRLKDKQQNQQTQEQIKEDSNELNWCLNFLESYEKISKRELLLLLYKVNGNLNLLTRYLETQDANLLWTKEQDLMLKNISNMTPREVEKFKELKGGKENIEKRGLYLEVKLPAFD